MLNQLTHPSGAKKNKRRIGRGYGSRGKTSGRGHKGQRSRSGGRVSIWFEGGQTPLKLRSKKRGFKHISERVFEIINLSDLSGFKENELITPELLKERGIVSGKRRIKVLGQGELKSAITVKAHSFSRQAIEKVEQLGGKAQLI